MDEQLSDKELMDELAEIYREMLRRDTLYIIEMKGRYFIVPDTTTSLGHDLFETTKYNRKAPPPDAEILAIKSMYLALPRPKMLIHQETITYSKYLNDTKYILSPVEITEIDANGRRIIHNA